MDWTNNGTRPAQPAPAGGSHNINNKRKKLPGIGGLKLASILAALAVAALIFGLVYFLTVGKSGNESKFVDDSKLQAVFLNGGQVYFGKIDDLNNKFLRMSNIYYLRVNQTVQPNQENAGQQANANDISLVKLGCELHGPEDEMLINREQVVFWENLKADGQVAKAVDEYVKANPNGQQCNTNTGTDANTNNTNTQQQQQTNTNPTTPATNNPTTPAPANGTNRR